MNRLIGSGIADMGFGVGWRVDRQPRCPGDCCPGAGDAGAGDGSIGATAAG
ncbi:MAG TPA: hypothetical protein ACN46Q_00080 [Prochlorococcus sp.]